MLSEKIVGTMTRSAAVRRLWRTFPIGSVKTRVQYDIFDRPHYAYGVFAAAELAGKLGLGAVQVMEFGVAGGAGLLALERIARAVESCSQIKVDVCGFDSGQGMPPASDYRDLPHVWSEGFYQMDVPKLKAALHARTGLVIGDIRKTLAEWKPASPVGFIAFDLDYYSSTRAALTIFDRPSDERLPRIYSYFDDIMWPEYACHNERVGELCAIREFNSEHADKNLSPIHMFSHMRPHRLPWNDKMYVLHDFSHPLYCRNLTENGRRHRQMPLR